MSYIDENRIPGETVIYETRLHWIVMLRYLFWAAVFAAAGASLVYYAYTRGTDPTFTHLIEAAGAGFLVAAVIAIAVGAARRNATEMAVTSHRVVIKVGLASRRTIEMMLAKIESIEVKETAVGRMLGYGTIVVIGTGGTPEPFPRVAHPLQFRSAVQQQIEKLP